MAKLPSNNAEIFELLNGRWEILRKVSNNDIDKITHIMKGSASFTKQPNGQILYEEIININEHSVGTKKYLFVLSGTSILQYHFKPSPQQKLFPLTSNHPDAIRMYSLNFGQRSPLEQMISVGHYLCFPDQYYVTYAFSTESNFNTVYSIIGPHKHQNIDTSYTRISKPTDAAEPLIIAVKHLCQK